MAEQGEHRRLAAIFAADMVGYSRLTEADERGTIARQKTHHAELIDPKIAEHHRRIVKTTSDGLLVEFVAWVYSHRSRGRSRTVACSPESNAPPWPGPDISLEDDLRHWPFWR